MPSQTDTLAVPVAAFINTIAMAATAGAALLLVYISYLLEVQGYGALLGSVGAEPLSRRYDVTLAEGLAAGFNIAKITLIFIVARLMIEYGSPALSAKSLRGFVLLLSLSMSLVVFAGQTISPNAEVALAERQREITANADAEAAEVSARFDARAERAEQSYERRITAEWDAHQTRLAELNAELAGERMIGGQNFAGARFRDIEQRIEAQRAQGQERVDTLRGELAQELAQIEQEREPRLQTIADDAQAALDAVQFGEVFDSHEAQHPWLLRAVEVVRSVTPGDRDIYPGHVTVGLALFISLAIELLPMVMLHHVFTTLARIGAPTASSTKSPANQTVPPLAGQAPKQTASSDLGGRR